MSLELTAELEGEKELSRTLGIATTKLKDFTPPLRKIEGEIEKSYQLNFSSRGGLFGGWAPRKPQYKNGRRVDTWPLMEKTGRLRSGYTSGLIGKTGLEISNDTSYFKYHQSNRPRTHLPRRVLLKLDQARKTFIVKSFQSYIISSLRGQ